MIELKPQTLALLDEIESRIDPEIEDDFRRQWSDFLHHRFTGCCFSKRMRKLFIKNEKSVLRFCNKSSKTKRAFTKVLMPCKRPF
jgi:hypothetical protein